MSLVVDTLTRCDGAVAYAPLRGAGFGKLRGFIEPTHPTLFLFLLSPPCVAVF
jgi:hypothetical protein